MLAVPLRGQRHRSAVPQFMVVRHYKLMNTVMKLIIVCILSCLSVVAAGTNDIRVVTWTYKIMPEDSLATVEVFTRGGQTNLVRNTHTKDGVVLFRSQSFYCSGTEVGSYMYQIANGTNTGFSSAPGAHYYFNVGFDNSNRPRSAHIMATNLVMLDWFLCTNGVFYPAEGSLIQEANDRLTKGFPPH
jgi:hypothetical protein